LLLARMGHNVLLVDRDTFPSDTLSTAFIQGEGMARLEKWGLRQRLLDTGCPELTTTLYAFGVALPAPAPPVMPTAPRRIYLDKLLVDAARESGAEVREAFSVQEVMRDGAGTVVGVMGHGRDGMQVIEEGHIVIGADGRNSFVARAVEAEEYRRDEPSSCGFYTYFSGLEASGAELHLVPRHAFFVFPSNNGQTCIGYEGPLERWDEMRRDPGAYAVKHFEESAPALAARVRAATQAERWLGLTGRASFFRKPYGPGWALVGDAGYLKDPILGRGIDDAFRDAELVAEAVHAGLTGAKPMEEALAGYQSARDATVTDLYDLNQRFAHMPEWTPELLMEFGAHQGAVPA
jgi:flavin-dependent dehydrogenase